ncbi:MAG: DUF2786 domain-containing protein [Aeromicrobium sp.]
MASVDPEKRATYQAENRLNRWLASANPGITVDLVTYEPEVEGRFVGPADVQRYVDRVLEHLRDAGKDYGGAEREDVRVRARHGHTRAVYSFGVIAIPPFEVGGSWALRELVVLHEIAHHLDGSGGHGAGFRATFIRLLEDIGRPVWAELLHLAFASEGLGAVEHHVADDTIAKVAKVLRQAERASNEHERAAYLAKAQSLATRHAIAFAVARAHLHATERSEQPVEETVVIGASRTRGLARYVRLLLNIAAANDLKALIRSDSTQVYLYGFQSDIDITKAIYQSVLVQMVSDCQTYLRHDDQTRHIPTITRRLAFYEGYAARIGQRLNQASHDAHADAVDVGGPALSDSTALALKAKELEVSDFFADILRKQKIRGSWRGSRTPSWHNAPASWDAGSSAAAHALLGGERALASAP